MGSTSNEKTYIESLLKRFDMMECNAVSTPMDAGAKLSKRDCPSEEEKLKMKKVPYQEHIGSLLFLANVSRPDISYSVNFLSRYNSNPGNAHWVDAKRVIRYLKGTINHKMLIMEVIWMKENLFPDMFSY